MKKTAVLTVVLIIILSSTSPVVASIEGLLVKAEDGSFNLYAYGDLLDSYALNLVGLPNGLYEDFKLKNPVAFLRGDGDYIDYKDTLDYYATMILSGQKFSFENYVYSYRAKKFNAPVNLMLVTVSSGELIRQEISAALAVNPSDASAPPLQVNALVDIPIIAVPQLTLARAAEWAKDRNANQRFIDIAPLYWEFGRLTGICPEVLYAQAAHETNFGHFTGQVPPSYHNWAGIKTADAAGDKPEDHEQFATPEDGVRAHFNHMAAYVGLKPIGDPHGRYFIVNRLSWAGTVKFIEELSGKWAPSATYHVKIATFISELRQ